MSDRQEPFLDDLPLEDDGEPVTPVAGASAPGAAAAPSADAPLDDPDTAPPPPGDAEGEAPQAPAAEPSASWQPAEDALLQCLVWLTRHHGRERSAESLAAALDIQQALQPEQALRLLREAGFKSSVIKRPLPDLNDLLLPAVLIMRDGEACVLTRRLRAAKGETARYELVLPDAGFPSCTAAEDELLREYTGYTLAASPDVEATSSSSEPELQDPAHHWLWGTLRRFIPYYRASLLAALLSNVLMMSTGLVTSVVFDKVIPHQAFVTLWALAIGAGIAVVFDLFSRQLRSHLIDLAGRKADMLMGSILFRQALGVRMEHRPTSAGSYAHTLAQIEVVREFFASASLSALSDLPFTLLFVAMCFVIGGPLGWVLVLAIPVIMVIAMAIQGVLRRSMSAHMRQQADLQGVLVEAVEGLEDLKAAGAQGRFLRQYEDATAAASRAQLRARNASNWASNLSAAAQQVVTLVMLVWGVYLIRAGVVTGGALIGCVMFAGRAIAPLGSLVSLATRYQGARAAMRALDRQMQAPLEREPGRNYVAMPELSGRIGLTGVSFAYPATSAQAQPVRVLKDIQLQFAPGERVAILGRIGSGKSTILRLLAGLYQPTEGMVEVDGIDLRQLDPTDFRSRVGLVTQEPRLFHGSLRDNVLLGRAWARASELSAVARLTGLDRMVSTHPQGWDLPVGEMGGLLSGGQRQLVALARCLVTRPRILLMDEPTSSMDAQSEVGFLRRLKEAAGDCTLIMVTHRPAVLELVDRIVVIEAGKLLMDGPKAQVLAALSGRKPVPAAPAGAADTNVHRHPGTQPVQQAASV